MQKKMGGGPPITGPVIKLFATYRTSTTLCFYHIFFVYTPVQNNNPCLHARCPPFLNKLLHLKEVYKALRLLSRNNATIVPKR